MNAPARPVCPRCLRPQRTCICHWIRPVENLVDVLLLQHPLEVDHAKGSARLLHLSLSGNRLVAGERFDETQLRSLLYMPFQTEDTDNASDGTIQPILLYPADPGTVTPIVNQNPSQHAPHSPHRYRLVVLDGTWRKSRKMLHLNPLLQQLPRLSLLTPAASHYAIRKAHRPDQLSTFEATCHALMQLENDEQKYRPLLAAFDGFVAQQQSHVASSGQIAWQRHF